MTRNPKKPRDSKRKSLDNRPRKKNSTPPNQLWLYGTHPVKEALKNPQRTIHRLVTTKSMKQKITTMLEHMGLKNQQLEIIESFDALLPDGSVHQNIAALVSPLPGLDMHDLLASTKDKPTSTLLVLDGVTDPHNIGAILRSAAAFGAHGIILAEQGSPAETAVMAKTACGALEHVPITKVVNLRQALDLLNEHGYWSIGLAEEGSEEFHTMSHTAKTAIVLGAEGKGLKRLIREACDSLARLPTQPPIGSLNVSNAAAVALYGVTTTHK